MKRKFLFAVERRKLKKEDFNDQLLRMIISFKLFFANVSNIKIQKTFFYLNDIIEFFSFLTIKNHFMFRYREIQKNCCAICLMTILKNFFYELLIVF